MLFLVLSDALTLDNAGNELVVGDFVDSLTLDGRLVLRDDVLFLISYLRRGVYLVVGGG